MNRIESLEVENFKSYKGRQTIGPFKKNFTAVIGPNGAGKSNLMDAISFVLGVTTSDLRGKQLKDLVFRFKEEDGGTPEKAKCFVKLNYINAASEKVTFRRSINVDQHSCTYHLNEKSVSWEVYLKALHAINIFPKLKNFLVFQGDVANVAQKSPKEITTIIEMVSGSAELKANYEELQEKEKTARESTMFQYQKKRGIAAEKRQFKEQTKEAERFNYLTGKIDKLNVKQNLILLFNLQKELTEWEEKKAAKTQKLVDLEKTQIDLLDKLNANKREQAKIHQQSLKQQKKIRENEKLLEKKRPSAIANREEVAFLERRIKDTESEVKRFEKMKNDQSGKIKLLKADLNEIEIQEADFDKAMAEKETTAVTLTAAQIKTYSSLKEDVGKRVAKESNELQIQDRQQKVEQSTLDNLKNQSRSLKQRQEEIAKEIAVQAVKIEKILAAQTEIIQNKTKAQAELDETLASNNEAKRKQTEISDKLRDIHTALHEAKHDIEHSEKQKKYDQAMESLKRMFPGVYGRILDLSHPKNVRYNTAITVALGKHMDSVIVDTQKTGMQCIEYMKEQRVGTATFIPLDSIKTRPIDESLRSLGKRVHPIIDVMQFDPHFQKAFEYVCGTTLVVENMDEARKVAFGKERQKVVTVDGNLISKSGMMTGGTSTSGRIAEKARRWEMKEINKLKKDRDDYLKSLTEIGHQLRSFAREQQLQHEVTQLDSRHQAIKYELELAREKQKKNDEDQNLIARDLKKIQGEKKKVKTALEKRAQKIEELKAAINVVEDQVFKKFSSEVGIENVREYETARVDRAKEASEAKIRFSTQRSRIEHLLEYEEGRDLQKSIDEQNGRAAEERKKLKVVQANEKKSKEVLEKDREEHEALVAAYEKDRETIVDKERITKDYQRQLEGIRKAAGAYSKESGAIEHQQEHLRSKRHAILRAAARDEIGLPITSGLEELPGAVDPENLSEKFIQEDAIELDFSILSKKTQNLQKQQVDARIQKINQKVQGLILEREAIAPNLKATERLGDVSKRLDTVNTEFEEAKKEARVAVEAFKAIKEKRCRVFMHAFDLISKNIDSIYKELTGGAGAAYLTLDNMEEPYLHGTTYNPMPPNKPFGDIENLSGGEKSVAALALLFAIASFKPAPFFVLDEVDAALDLTNVLRVATYLKNKAEKDKMQFITISLKDKCFEKAGALVGVYIKTDDDSRMEVDVKPGLIIYTGKTTIWENQKNN